MNSFLNPLLMTVAAGSLFALTGCHSVSTSHTRLDGAPNLAATEPAGVRILRTEPAEAYVRLGEIRAEPLDVRIDEAAIEKALRREAAKLGADAVIVRYDRTTGPEVEYVGAWRTREAEPEPVRVIGGVAIKFR